MWAATKKGASEAGRAWLRFECASMAAGVAFYAALSLFPLLLLLISGAGWFLTFVERGRDAKEAILETVSQQLSPEVAGALGDLLGRVQSEAPVTGPLAGVILLLTASLVFMHIDRGFNRIWEVHRRGNGRGFFKALKRLVLGRLRSLVMLLGTGLVVLLVFTAGLVMRAVNAILREWFPAAMSLSSFGTALVGVAVNALVFFLLYQLLSKERVGSRSCFWVAAGAAVFWEIGSRAMSALSLQAGLSLYGVIGSFLLVQVWIYYTAMVLFAGAVVVRVLARPLDAPVDSGQPA